ncbi:SRPBCC family protein [Nocardia coubleae]|uniref:SRPBCC family protein n=1 Tax=Nocardia coubleae TaxID=356147 RepID=A0A846VZ91_9NOCA|nr:SRPBCC family protein [Nocardia coubleae]NKX86161.1 SRPBCC family protein [Nocardia coubleae]
MLDIIDQINRTMTDLGPSKQVRLARTYDTTTEDLWDACTDPHRLSRWFEPVSGELREGGRYRLDGSGTTGTIEECVAPTRLRITWEYGDDTSVVEVTITGTEDGATLELTHSVPDNEHWRTFGPGATGVGWETSFLAVGFFLSGDDRATPAELEKLLSTPEGAEYIRRAASAWGDAHTTAGTDPATARTVADRVACFYTGAE